MRYATVCSGIEAPSVAWHHLGWEPVWFSEIDPFASAVLAHHYPTVPNLGDMNLIHKHAQQATDFGGIELICGGTPCQSFSLAGLRKGLSDPRGNLALVYLGIVDRVKPKWVIWENVPGVLSSWSSVEAPDENGEWEETNDFSTFVTALEELGYGVAWRVLDAQYFGVPQRRRRIFVVGCLGDWRSAAAVLFDSACVRRNPSPLAEAGARVAALTANGVGTCGADDNQARAGHIVMAHGQGNAEVVEGVSPTLNRNHESPIIFDSRQSVSQGGTPSGIAQTLNTDAGRQAVMVDFRNNKMGDVAQTIAAGSHSYSLNTIPGIFMPGQGAAAGSIAFSEKVSPTLKASASGTNMVPAVLCPTLTANNDPSRSPQSQEITAQVAAVSGSGAGLRRITPREAERLQGFPDDYTLVPFKKGVSADAHRYKAIGNSMAVPVMQWIGERIQNLEK